MPVELELDARSSATGCMSRRFVLVLNVTVGSDLLSIAGSRRVRGVRSSRGNLSSHESAGHARQFAEDLGRAIQFTGTIE